MPFIPLRAEADFPRVSPEEQAARDATAERLVAAEFEQDMPDENRAALEVEYRQRFGNEPPSPVRGFIPLSAEEPARGFVPLKQESPQPSLLKTIALNNPATAVGEAALNLGSQALVMPLAGLAGLGAEAARAMGLTERTGADVVHDVLEAGTYQPRGEFGKAAAGAVMAPFEALAKVGHAAGDKVLELSGSPVAATVVDTAINAAPMLIDPAARAVKRVTGVGEPPALPAPKTEADVLAARSVDEAISAFGESIDQSLETAAAASLRELPIAQVAKPETRLPLEAEPNAGRPAVAVSPAEGLPAEVAVTEAGPWSMQRNVSGNIIVSAGDAEAAAFEPMLRQVMGQNGISLAKIIDHDGGLSLRVPKTADEATVGQIVADLNKWATDEGWSAPKRTGLENTDAARPAQIEAAVGEIRAQEHPETAMPDPAAPFPDTPLEGLRDQYAHARAREAEANGLGDSEFSEQYARAREAGDVPAVEQATGFVPLRSTETSPAFQPAGLSDVGAARSIEPRPDGTVRVRGYAPEEVRAVAKTLGVRSIVGRDMAIFAKGADPLRVDALLNKSREGPDTRVAGNGAVEISRTVRPADVETAGPALETAAPVRAQVGEANQRRGFVPLEGVQDMATGPDNGAFARWFGKSQAVDAEGKPLVVYHATTADIAKFDRSAESIFDYGRNQDSGGIFFTSDPKAAEYYTRGSSGYERGANIIPAYIRLENPIRIRAGMNLREQASLLRQADAAGHDGAIIGDSEYVVFHPGQAKSVFNRGTFSRDDAGLLALDKTQNGTWNPGANHVGFVDQVRLPASSAKSVADLPEPLRREQIIGDLAKALGTTVYEGRVKGKNRLGFFRKGVEEVRTKRANDIEVAAHEIAHLVDARVPEIQRAYIKDKALRDELRSVSYDQKNVKEGFAEAVRLWMTQPETLEAKAPKVHAWLEQFAGSHKYGPALRQAQGDMVGWFAQDALNRARSKIGSDKHLADYFDGFWDKFRQSTVDDLHGIYRIERDLTGKINPAGAYESARLSWASHSIADGAVRYGHPVKNADGSYRYAGKGLEEILRPVAENLDDTLLYFVGRSARELMGQGREHLFSQAEIDAMLRLRTPARDQAFKEYQTWNRGILDFAESQGILNSATRRQWQRAEYLPFYRVGQGEGFKGKPGDWSGIKALTGGTENLRDVIGNMVGNAAQLIDRAVKNEALQKLAELAEKNGGAKFMVKIDAEARPVKIDRQQVIDTLMKQLGVDLGQFRARGEKLPKKVRALVEELEDSPAFLEFMMGNQPPAGRNVVAVLNDGKPTWYEVGDPILYRALQAMDRLPMHWLTRILGAPKRIGQLSITLTPDFMVANIARDTLMAGVMSRAGFRPVLDSLDGMRMRMTSDPVYRDWVANGGGLSSLYLDEAKLRTKLEKFYTRQGVDYRTVLDAPDKLLGFVETMADAFESSTRLGEFKRAIERGENPRHAAYLARDVSTDFAMKGDSQALGFMFDTVMFLRPAVVSLDRLFRGVAHDPNKAAIAVKTGLVALASMGLYLLNRDDPRYAGLQDWDRDAHWHFFVGDQHFKMPKIWEIGAIASAAERTVEKTMATDPAGLGKDLARIIGNVFSLNLMPQVVAPVAEQAANRNSFTKAPIETPGMANVQPFLRAKPTTSETMKAAGMATRDLPEALQVNPVRAEALLRGYLNTWALYGLALSDRAFFGDKLPETRTDQLPVVRRFYSQEPAQHTKFESQFYDMLDEAKRLHGTLRELDKQGLRDYADEKEKEPLATEAKPLERAAKNLQGINAEMLDVRRSSMAPDEKRTRLDVLTRERNALLKAAVTDSENARKEKQQ